MTDLSTKEKAADTSTSARSEYRDCPPWDVCSDNPCRHLLCYDPDWLEDAQDGYRDPSRYGNLWLAYYNASYRQSLPADALREYETKFDRCRRMHEKRREIKAEMRYRQNILLQADGYDVEDDLRYAESEVEALEQELGKRFPWYKRRATS
jgi:hypothetical protein